MLLAADILKSPLGYVRLQTLQSYDGRDIPATSIPLPKLVATNKFSVLSQGNLVGTLSVGPLETLSLLSPPPGHLPHQYRAR